MVYAGLDDTGDDDNSGKKNDAGEGKKEAL